MLSELNAALHDLPALLQQPERWGSIVINRRKPYTYRAFTDWRGYRLCLHRFETCDEQEAVLHPHPWPGAFAILQGRYLMGVGYSVDRHAPPNDVLRTLLAAGSRYEIVHPLTWHSVIPQEECYTVMLNGPAWTEDIAHTGWTEDIAHTGVRRTQGKGLVAMNDDELRQMFDVFQRVLR